VGVSSTWIRILTIIVELALKFWERGGGGIGG